MSCISIITPVHNRLQLFKETFSSVLAQTSAHWEWIIVDDGSESDVKLFLSGLHSQKHIKVYTLETPQGACFARNFGAEKAANDLLLFLDSDDILKEDCVENRLSFINNHPTYDAWVFSVEIFKQHPSDLGLLWNTIFDDTTNESDLARFLRQDIPWQTSTLIWTKEAFNKTGGFNTKSRSWQDYELHVNFLLQYPNLLKSKNKPDIYIRRGNESITRQSSQIEHLRQREHLIDTIFSKLNSTELSNKAEMLYINLSSTYIKLKHEKEAWRIIQKIKTTKAHQIIIYNNLYFQAHEVKNIYSRILRGLFYRLNLFLQKKEWKLTSSMFLIKV